MKLAASLPARGRRMPKWLAPLMAIVVVVLGLAMKAARYSAPPQLSREAAAAHISVAMRGAGWQPAGPLEARVGGLYSQLLFARAGCPHPVAIALLDGNAESADFVSRAYAGDLVFVQEGQIVRRPSGLRRHWSRLIDATMRNLGWASGEMLPILAVSPAKSEARTSCDPPMAALLKAAR